MLEDTDHLTLTHQLRIGRPVYGRGHVMNLASHFDEAANPYYVDGHGAASPSGAVMTRHDALQARAPPDAARSIMLKFCAAVQAVDDEYDTVLDSVAAASEFLAVHRVVAAILLLAAFCFAIISTAGPDDMQAGFGIATAVAVLLTACLMATAWFFKLDNKAGAAQNTLALLEELRAECDRVLVIGAAKAQIWKYVAAWLRIDPERRRGSALYPEHAEPVSVADVSSVERVTADIAIRVGAVSRLRRRK